MSHDWNCQSSNVINSISNLDSFDDCSVGDLYVPRRPRLILAEGWYLNTEYPSPCSGNVTGLSMHYYNILGNSCLWWALFEPIGSNNYVQVKWVFSMAS